MEEMMKLYDTRSFIGEARRRKVSIYIYIYMNWMHLCTLYFEQKEGKVIYFFMPIFVATGSLYWLL